MFVREKKKPNGNIAVQIVASQRRGSKVSQSIIRHIGQATNDSELKQMKQLAQSILFEIKNQKQLSLPLFDPQKIQQKIPKKQPQQNVNLSNLREEQRVIEGIPDLFGKLFEQLGFDQILRGTKNNSSWNQLLKSCTLARLANPASKRRTASLLEQDFGLKVPLDRIYRLMDHVARCENSIKRHIANTTKTLFKQHVDVLFFDVTTLSFESIQTDGLREFGFSKDCKFNETQVMLALVTTTDGMPLTYQLFPGNTCEGKTLVDIVKALKQEYNVNNVSLVADRAMFHEENLLEMEALGVTYIVAAKLKTLPKARKQEILGEGYHPTVVKDELQWVKELEHKQRRLIVSYSGQRAKKDASDRARLVEKLMKKVKADTVKVKDLISNHGAKKYIHVDPDSNACVDEEKIEKDALWDGLHGVISNCKKRTASELLRRYRQLWQIEESFRISKHDLKMRPIYHWKADRIRGHIALCFIAYTLARQAMHRVQVQHEAMSFEALRNELLHCQASIVRDISTKKLYRLPSKITTNQKKLYQIFGLKRSEVPVELKM